MTEPVEPRTSWERPDRLHVITGGAGFVGSHLCEALLGRGHRVLCVDSLLTGNWANVAHLSGRAGFGFLHHDVSRHINVSEPVDSVLHLASPASPVDYLQKPIQTLKAGSLGTLNALGLAKANNARFLLASTSEIYGDPEQHPQTEQYRGSVDPVGLRGVYNEAKRFAEALTMAYHRSHGTDTRIARIFNTYGPRLRAGDGRVVSNFVVAALAGRPLAVHGSGDQTRSFCYVDDLVQGLMALLFCDESQWNEPAHLDGAAREDEHQEADRPTNSPPEQPHAGRSVHEPVNLGNPVEITVNELAAAVLRICDSRLGAAAPSPSSLPSDAATAAQGNHIESRIERTPARHDDPHRRCPDISVATRHLGWRPGVSLETGLTRTVNWFATQPADHQAAPVN